MNIIFIIIREIYIVNPFRVNKVLHCKRIKLKIFILIKIKISVSFNMNYIL